MEEYKIRYSMKLKDSKDEPIYCRSIIKGESFELAVLMFVLNKRKEGWIVFDLMEDLEVN